MTLARPFQPNKMANATEIVGALHQDRHSGIMGVLGDDVADDSGDAEGALARTRTRRCTSEKDFHFNVFVHQKWTPYLMMLTLFNSHLGAERISPTKPPTG